MLSPLLLERLRAWWRVAHAKGKMLEGGWLFPGQNPVNPMSTRQFNRICHLAAEAAAIDKRVSPHTLRHSYATHPLKSAGISRPVLEVADIFRAHGPHWRRTQAGHLSLGQLKFMSAIERCRSAELGGHVLQCQACQQTRIAYNSCRNRHCPKCQASAARRWLDARQADLLPVEYYYFVFTLPAPISAIAYYNKSLVYGLLFQAAAETLGTLARSEAPRCPHRCDLGAAPLGLGHDPPPPCARHRARRRPVTGRRSLGRLPARLLPAGACALATVPTAVP
jgi:hypothetical protein